MNHIWPVCCLVDNIAGGFCKWTVNIISLQRWIGVGLYQIKQAEKHAFEKGDSRSTGHGQYGLSSSGYVFSHSDPNINDKKVTFEFNVGDILHVWYDSKKENLNL